MGISPKGKPSKRGNRNFPANPERDWTFLATLVVTDLPWNKSRVSEKSWASQVTAEEQLFFIQLQLCSVVQWAAQM